MAINASKEIAKAIIAANEHAEKHGREQGFVYLKSYLSMIRRDIELQDTWVTQSD